MRSLIVTAKNRVKGVVLESPGPIVLTPAQSRMARAALIWSIVEAARAAGVSYRTILRFESEQRDIQPGLIAALRRAFEAAGLHFIEEGADADGVTPTPLRVLRPR